MAAYRDLRSGLEPENIEEERSPRYPPGLFLHPRNAQQKYDLSQHNQVHMDFGKNVPTGPPRYFSVVIRLADAFCENVLAHPFIVVRRQCQIHQNSRCYHLLPFTLIPVIIKLHGRQGLGTLWKGIGSVFIVKGLTILCEDVLSKITHWPKNISYLHSIQNILQHIVLKFVSASIATPFYSASLIETVQSDIASEKPTIFDCIVEGVDRVIPRKHSPTSRILPVWTLAVPTAAHSVLHYVVSSVVQHVALSFWRYRESRSLLVGHKNDDTVDTGYAELTASFIGHVTSDVLLYPFETVLNRLHVQGTRTIIDNLDTGHEVTPVITNYEGPMDCLQTIVDEEGAAGFFKGFGALVLQYALHAAVITVTKFVFVELKCRSSKKNTSVS